MKEGARSARSARCYLKAENVSLQEFIQIQIHKIYRNISSFTFFLKRQNCLKLFLTIRQICKNVKVLFFLQFTIILAALFTKLQVLEYGEGTFTIADSVYGSAFFLMTGFHGIHVFIGTCFLFVCLFRFEAGHFSRYYHFGFEAAIWYWHFVDVVWILLFIVVYWWGGVI